MPPEDLLLIIIIVCLAILGIFLFKKYLIVVYLTGICLFPVSAVLYFNNKELSIIFPTELFYSFFLFISILFFIYNFRNLSKDKYLRHPLSITIMFHLLWIFITALVSEMRLVSFKFLVMRSWYVIPVFFLFYYFFKDNFIKKVEQVIIVAGALLTLFVTYILIRHSEYYFDHKVATWITKPFFPDHTSYGATIAFLIFPFMGIMLRRNWIIGTLMGCILIAGLLFSFSRAAWLSLLFGIIMMGILYLRISFKALILFALLLIAVLYLSSDFIFGVFFEAKGTMAGENPFVKKIVSLMDLRYDPSNAERLNRWVCAMRMFEERPILGWGPGTYMFLYDYWQTSDYMTMISTHWGDVGNAHSEFWGTLSEQGFPGALLWILMNLIAVYVVFSTYTRLKNKNDKLLLLTMFGGYSTYLFHSNLNNFLDLDKISVPFWLSLSLFVYLNIKVKEKSGAEFPNAR